MRSLLVGLTLLLTYCWTDFVPLRISVIRPGELGSFSAKIEVGDSRLRRCARDLDWRPLSQSTDQLLSMQ